jgi:Ca2+-binding RTX toxin-like protein
MAIINGTSKNDVIDEHDGVTNGDDSISSGLGNDLVFGLGGNDWFWQDTGADTIYGGSGTDTVAYYYHASASPGTEGVWVDLASGTGSRGAAAGDRYYSVENVWGSIYADNITGNDGDNELHGWSGDDVIKGGGGADDLYGESGNDTIKGGAGADILDGGLGIDTLLGGTEDDLYYVQPDDTVIESAGEGYDFVYILGDNYTLPDNVEGLYLYSQGAVTGTGNGLANILYGNDIGNVLDGAGGADHLFGFGGNDTFVFKAGQGNGDVVWDFQGNGAAAGDVLKFVGYGPGATLNQIDSTHWVIASADNSIQDVITLANGASLSDFGDYVLV